MEATALYWRAVTFSFRFSSIAGIKILAPVDVSVIAFSSDVFDIFLLAEHMSKRHWHLSPLQFPSGFVNLWILHTVTFS